MQQPSQLPPSLQLVPNITVSIEGDDYVVVNELTGEVTFKEPFGADYAGPITIKAPTILDDIEMPCIVTAATQRFNVLEAGALPLKTYRLIQAIAWFQVLGVKPLPPWLSEGVASSEKRKAAIVHAYDVTHAKLEEAKKNSEPGGASGSPTS